MDILNEILGLPHLSIDEADLQNAEIHLHVDHCDESAICPRCHMESIELHQQYDRIIRDLPMSGKPCYLHVTTRRLWCSPCGLPFFEPLDWLDPYRSYTKRYEAHIYELVRHNNITFVETLEGLSYEVVEGIFLREANRRIPAEPFIGVQRLGIDEIAEHKGRNAFDLLFYNLDTGQPIEMLRGRTKKNLTAYLTALPEAVKAEIEEVCIDMWRPYAQAVSDALPQAELVVDRFHVMKSVNKDLKALKNARKQDLPEEAKSCHYPLLKNQDDLTEKQQTTLNNVYDADPLLKRAHQLKEQFRSIFETIQPIDIARKQLKKWVSKAFKHDLFPTVITEMKTWFSATLNYFKNRTTNSPSEGVNNKVKVVKRRAYGFRNFDNFRLRILTAFL